MCYYTETEAELPYLNAHPYFLVLFIMSKFLFFRIEPSSKILSKSTVLKMYCFENLNS